MSKKEPPDGAAPSAASSGESVAEVELTRSTIDKIVRDVREGLQQDLSLNPSREPLPKLATTKQVAELLEVSERHVQQLAAAGRLRPVRIGKRTVRYPLAQVTEFIRTCAKGTKRPFPDVLRGGSV